MANYIIRSQVPLTNWYIEEFIRNCGYCEFIERRFVTYSSKRYCEFELYFKVNKLKVFGLRHDINKVLKDNYGKKCKYSYTIERARK